MINIQKYENLIIRIVNSIDSSNLGKTKLYKLLFFIDYENFKKNGNTITGDDYLRYPMGPVPKSFWEVVRVMEDNGKIEYKNEIKYYPMVCFKALKEEEPHIFESEEEEVINSTIESKKNLTRQQLINQTHDEDVWKNAEEWSVLKFDKNANNSISYSERDGLNTKDLSASDFLSKYKTDLEILKKR